MLNYLKSVSVPEKGITYYPGFAGCMAVISIFSKEIGSYRTLGFDFDYIAYPFAVLYFFFNLKEVLFCNQNIWKIYLYILVSSLFSIFIFQFTFEGFLKQAIPILIIYSVNFFIVGKDDLYMLFELYVKYAFLSAIFGIVQVIVSYGGINLLNRQAGRLDSIAYEPSHYAAILVPALVFVFFHFKKYKLYFFTMLIALILTYNLTAYLAFLLVISVAFISPIYLITSIPILYYLVFYVLPNFNENFNIRILETQAVFRGDLNVLNRNVEANGTTISLYSNLMVAWDNFKKGNWIGSGLGGHEESYYKYYAHSIFRYNWFFGLNAPSGHSLTIRIFSEFGIIGLLLYFFILVKKIILLDNGIYRSISLACLSHFICKSFKLGAYIDYGTPFFFSVLLINFTYYQLYKTKSVEINEGKALPLSVSISSVARLFLPVC